MFKFGIFPKLFLVLLLCILSISGIFLASVHWSFKNGFNQYLLQAEATQLDKLMLVLRDAYIQNGNWQFLQDNPSAWFHLIRQGLEEQHLPPRIPQAAPPEFGPSAGDPPMPPPEPPLPPEREFRNPEFRSPHRHPHDHDHDHEGPHGPPEARERIWPALPWLRASKREQHHEHHELARFLGGRIQLLDSDKNYVVGLQRKHQTELLRPIQMEDRVIGWLSIQSSDLITDHLALLFVTQQIRNNYLLAALTACLAILCSLLLARKLLIPIKRITAGASALAEGRYDTQIKINSRDELGELADNFNLLARTLSNNEQARRRWIADISHELRTPLAILRGEIEAVQDGIREFSPESIKSLYAEVMSLNTLVDDLYELSLSDLGNHHYQMESLDITGVLEDVIANQRPRFQAQQLQLNSAFDQDAHILIHGDVRRLYQLFSNLCENSRRYTTSGGYCEIHIQIMPKQVILLFQDTPPGVPEASLDKLFERLYRVDESRNRERGGAGLGLAICKAIVTAHSGAIEAFHSAYGGLGIRITLPRI